jgi:hypothetical protein
MALDLALYRSGSRRIEREHLRAAWRNYFVRTANPAAGAAGPTPGGF